VWRDWYRYFPWEDWRRGKPAIVSRMEGQLKRWIAAAAGKEERQLREARVQHARTQARRHVGTHAHRHARMHVRARARMGVCTAPHL
jgi:hypothetical protein